MVQGDMVVGLDLGTTKICAVIAEVTEEKGMKVIGVGTSPSDGLRRGVVVDVEKTVRAVENAVREAELMAGVQVSSAYINIAGEHISSLNSRGVIALGGHQHEISSQDKERVIAAASSVAIPFDRELLHVLPQEFIVDDQRGIRDPSGMSGVRLETTVHIVTGAVTAAQNICKSVQRAGIQVRGVLLEPLAAARAVLEDEEKEMGVCLVDLGGGTADVAVFYQGSVRHTAIVGLGGQSITNDIAICLRTSWPHAEKLKCEHGVARVSAVGEAELVEVPGVAGRASQDVARRELASIIQARLEEILGMVRAEIRRPPCAELLGAGVVLTGGGAQLEGVAELAEQVLELPVRPGLPQGFQGMTEKITSTAYATALGLVLLGREREEEPVNGRAPRRSGRRTDQQSASVLGQVKKWLQAVT